MPEAVVESVDFRNAMARFASGVTVVTTVDVAGQRHGFTASAFSSLSLDPPLVLVCLEKKANSYAAFMAADKLGVSVLASGQDAVLWRFASKDVDKFVDMPISAGPATGAPLIDGALVQLECRVYDRLEGGDHTIILGEVLAVVNNEADPLVHYNRKLGGFAAV